MKKLSLIFLIVMFSGAASAGDVQFEKLYTQAALNIYLAKSTNHTKQDLKTFGHSVCGGKSFCLIWFFDNNQKATKGIATMKSGNTWDPITGLIGIYSKNRKIDDLICYEKSGTC